MQTKIQGKSEDSMNKKNQLNPGTLSVAIHFTTTSKENLLR